MKVLESFLLVLAALLVYGWLKAYVPTVFK